MNDQTSQLTSQIHGLFRNQLLWAVALTKINTRITISLPAAFGKMSKTGKGARTSTFSS